MVEVCFAELCQRHQVSDSLRAEIEDTDITAFNDYRQANPICAEDDEYGNSLDSEHALVRALTWLSAQTGDPVGFWHHMGDHGMIEDVFIGAGPFAIWENDSESQGDNWAESKPRSAYTASLWHIGARVPNVDECRSGSPTVGQPLFPVMAAGAEAQPSADRWNLSRDVTAITEKLKQVFSLDPANEHAGRSSVKEKWIGRLKRILSRD